MQGRIIRLIAAACAAATISVAAPSSALAVDLAVGCAGKTLTPADNIQTAINAGGAGATFCFAPGTYRLQRQLWPRTDQTFIGGPGVLFKGSEVLTFQPQGNLWVSPGHTQSPAPTTSKCTAAAGNLCNLPFRLYVDGKALAPVASLSELKPDTYYFDLATDNVYVGSDPSGKLVELGLAALGMSGTMSGVPAHGVEVSDITWEQFGNMNNGVISTFAAENWLIDGNEVRTSHGCGISGGTGAIVRNNFVHHMGQYGLCGQGKNMVVENNEISYNNTDGFDPRWDAGGTKWVNTTGLTVKNNYSHDNKGPGLWTDGNNLTTLYEGNRVERNTEEGIFHEISYDAIIRNNTVLNNGRNVGTWGAGIMVSSSPNVQIYGNTVSGAWNAVSLVQENRGSGASGPYTLKNVTVSDNILSMRKGTTGVFDKTGTNVPFTSGTIKFVANTYNLAVGDAWFSWAGQSLPRKSWQVLGMDKAGIFTLLK
ncbi:MAG TPA: right-handed parallel beta-helix repeat-containing protein [Actinomycetota bacterium]|nr:right-handed parallel beta-helix repeat-containing protein [Actinomycetota bacterium]